MTHWPYLSTINTFVSTLHLPSPAQPCPALPYPALPFLALPG